LRGGIIVVCVLSALSVACSGSRAAEKGAWQQLLNEVRPKDAKSLRLRGQALAHLGRLAEAGVELRLALQFREDDAEIHRLLGMVELRQGYLGSALGHLQRSLALDDEQPSVRRQVAALLSQRAALRIQLQKMGLAVKDKVAADLQQARRLGRPTWVRPGAVPRCTGVPAGWNPLRPFSTASLGRCQLQRPDQLLGRLRRRLLVPACEAVPAALSLVEQGCATYAMRLWELMEQESPADPRWSLVMARAMLAAGRRARAEQLLQKYIYLSRDRAGATLRAGRLTLLAGWSRRAGRLAVAALALARTESRKRAAIDLLDAAGLHAQAVQARKGSSRDENRHSQAFP